MAWKVGLLGGSCRDEAGDAVGFLAERPLRPPVGEDIVAKYCGGYLTLDRQ